MRLYVNATHKQYILDHLEADFLKKHTSLFLMSLSHLLQRYFGKQHCVEKEGNHKNIMKR